jgi:glycosyltransferase involved in cell wall biosynthesis
LILGERTDVPRLLQAADIELFPSLWEGLPGAVLEACAAGVPVLGSDIPGMREIARHLASVRLLSLAALNEEWASAALELLREYPRATRSRTTSAFAESPFVLSRAVAQNLALIERASASARA